MGQVVSLDRYLPRRDIEHAAGRFAIVSESIQTWRAEFRAMAGFAPEQLRLGTVMHAHLCRELAAGDLFWIGACDLKLLKVDTYLGMRLVEDEAFDRDDHLEFTGARPAGLAA